MIELKRITSADTEEYAYVEKLLTTSFPLEEYRPLKQWKVLTDSNPLFNNNIVCHDGKFVGLMTIWDFNNFYYIEHFAIDNTLRNGGYGSEVLTLLEELIDKPIILEVEMPTSNTAKRRVGFYQRYKFELWSQEYAQPPYRSTETALPMMLMCRGELNEQKDYDEVVNKMYKEVYNISE